MVHTDALLKSCVMHMLQVCILEGNTMFFLVKWNLYIVYEKAMYFGSC